MSKMYNMRFYKGRKIIQVMECDFNEARQSGNELADDIGDVRLGVYNEPLERWEFMGTFHGKMRYTNAFGEKCIIRPDFSGLDRDKQKGGAA